jgi:DNA-binding NarL/FixJ family response regulator
VDKIRVVLIDGSPVFPSLLMRYLRFDSRIGEITVVGDYAEVYEIVRKQTPDWLLLNPEIAGGDWLRAITDMRSLLPQAHILVMTVLDPKYYRQAALAAGADEAFSMADAEKKILPYVRCRLNGAE